MKKQTHLAMIGNVRRESDGATIKVRTHVNKGKQYPYASERQNTREVWRRARWNERRDAKINELLRKQGVSETLAALAAE